MSKRPGWMPQARSAQIPARGSASQRAAERWFVERDGMPAPSANLLARLSRLDDTNLKAAYSHGAKLISQELARLAAFSAEMTSAIDETGKAVEPRMMPIEFYQAMAVCMGSLDRLAAMRTRSAKVKDDLFADASDEDLDRSLANAMTQLLEEMPIEDIEAVLRRRKNLVAADEGRARWTRHTEGEAEVLELTDGGGE